jgi:predicted metal-dependent hydrolase
VERRRTPGGSNPTSETAVNGLLMNKRGSEEHFQAGIDLFNAGRFFECHEAWERVWLRASGTDKLFYQGMIQAAVAILHAQRGNLAGSRSLWDKAIDKLGPLPADYMEIALGEFREMMEQFLAGVLAGQGVADSPPKITRLRN